MTKSFRNRVALTVSAVALLSAGAVLTAQAFAARPTTAPAADATAGVAAPSDAAAVSMTDWNETRQKGSVVRP